jgi:hypothetical protein
LTLLTENSRFRKDSYEAKGLARNDKKRASHTEKATISGFDIHIFVISP